MRSGYQIQVPRGISSNCYSGQSIVLTAALTDVTERAQEAVRAHAAGAVVHHRSTVGTAVTAHLREATLHPYT